VGNTVNGEDIVISQETEAGVNKKTNSVITGNTVTNGDIVVIQATYVSISGNQVNGGAIRCRLDCEDISIVGNAVVDSDDIGIGVYDRALRTAVVGNVISRPQDNAIYIYNGVVGVIVDGNTILDAGEIEASRGGVYMDVNVSNIVISNNYLEKTTGHWLNYGIWVATTGTQENIIIIGNTLKGIPNPIYDPNGSATIVSSNVGYITENSGTATLTNGNTSVAFAHGLAAIPTVVNISFTGQPTNPTTYWYWTADATNITFYANNPGTAGLPFSWEALVR
jgi:hypothetical protein